MKAITALMMAIGGYLGRGRLPAIAWCGGVGGRGRSEGGKSTAKRVDREIRVNIPVHFYRFLSLRY